MDSLRAVASRVLQSVFSAGPMSQAKLDAAWTLVVGDGLARVTTATWRSDGVVEVRVQDQRWAKEVKRSAPLILDRLNGLFNSPVVSRIVTI